MPDCSTMLNSEHYAKGGEVDGSKIVFSKDVKGDRRKEFQILERDTKGMNGSQDKYLMRVVESWGSHPSLSGAKKFAESKGFAKGGEVELPIIYVELLDDSERTNKEFWKFAEKNGINIDNSKDWYTKGFGVEFLTDEDTFIER